MDFNIIKKDLKKPMLWMGSITTILIIISLVIILTIPISLENKITFTITLLLNFILIWIIASILIAKPLIISLFFNINVYGNLETKKDEIEVISSRYLHIFINVFLLFSFFIEITSLSMSSNIWWSNAFKSYWWVYFIILIINYIYLYLFFGIAKYLINQNKDFEKSYLDFLQNSKKQDLN